MSHMLFEAWRCRFEMFLKNNCFFNNIARENDKALEMTIENNYDSSKLSHPISVVSLCVHNIFQGTL